MNTMRSRSSTSSDGDIEMNLSNSNSTSNDSYTNGFTNANDSSLISPLLSPLLSPSPQTTATTILTNTNNTTNTTNTTNHPSHHKSSVSKYKEEMTKRRDYTRYNKSKNCHRAVVHTLESIYLPRWFSRCFAKLTGINTSTTTSTSNSGGAINARGGFEGGNGGAATTNSAIGTVLNKNTSTTTTTTSSDDISIMSGASNTTTNSYNKLNTKEKEGRIQLIKGLQPVFDGTKPASESVYICGIQPIRYFWFMLSGFCCDMIQFIIDLVLFQFLNITNPSTTWGLSFTISIIFRHSFHRYMVFGAYVGGYTKSLCRMYGGYSISIVLSTVFNHFMTTSTAIPHYVAYFFTLIWTGVFNYFILKHLWSFGGTTNGGGTTSGGASGSSAVNTSSSTTNTTTASMAVGETSPTSGSKVRRTISRR